MALFGPRRSLFGEILDWMIVPLLVLWPASVALAWLVAQGIATRPFDRELAATARSLGSQAVLAWRSGERSASSRYDLSAEDLLRLRADAHDIIVHQVRGPQGELLGGHPDLSEPIWPDDPSLWREVRLRDDGLDGHAMRVASVWVRTDPSRDDALLLVQVAEATAKRSQLTGEIVRGVILPQFVILPLAVLLVWLALARGIAPLGEVQEKIRRRDTNDLSPIDETHIPDEVVPLIQAINDLLARLDHSLGRHKHFLADAAHQLKTPLAGLRMQAELIERELEAGRMTPSETRRSLQQIALSSQRAAHMVNQLLAMARAEDAEHTQRSQPVNLAQLAIETVQDFVPQALDRHIDLGYEGPTAASSPLRVDGHPVLIGELIRNLVDNALLYTPEHGTVTVRVVDDPFGQVIVLVVEDSGPGIPLAEREQVFQPFYRALGTRTDGSGLGLAIVREIAQQHGAEVTLDDARPRRSPAREGEGPGARFTVRFASTRMHRAEPA